MKLADIMDKVEVGMKMVVRKERRLFVSGYRGDATWTVCKRRIRSAATV